MTPATTTKRAYDPERLITPAVRSFGPYVHTEPPAEKPARSIRLDWNESPYGASPKARAALQEFVHFHRYPSFDAGELRTALGEYIGVPAGQIIPGAGLDDVINTLAMLLLEPGDKVIISEPTFGVYRPLFSSHGAEVLDVPLTETWELDPDAILAAIDDRTKLVVICNPNNPTGNLFDPAAVERVCAEAPCVVAIDEAYAEFARVAHRPLMDTYPNVVILRTMSKFAGLAGLRVGYGAFPAELMPYLERVTPAFCNISAASSAVAIASLNDLDHLNGVIDQIIDDRAALTERLRLIPGVEPMPSATNFILMKLPVDDAIPVGKELARRGVFIRYYPEPALKRYLRASLGTPEENEIFATELADILKDATA